MGQLTVHKALGLKTFNNEITLDEGALIKADNVVIDRDDVIEPRRGMKQYTESVNDANKAKQMLEYKNRLLVHYANKLAYDDGSGTLSEFNGTYAEVESGLRIKGIESNGNFYFTTLEGVKKISAVTSADFTTAADFVLDAGAPEALDVEITSSASANGVVLANKAVAYKVLWGYIDVNDNLVLGAPSSSVTLVNDTALAVDSSIKFTLPDEVDTEDKYFFRIYRSAQVVDTAIPEEEMKFVIEAFPTSTDLTNGYVTYIDTINDASRDSGANLYTNDISGEGSDQANFTPPLCSDLAKFRDTVFYANTRSRHFHEMSLSTTSTLTNSSTILFDDGTSSFTISFNSATETPSTGTARYYTGPSFSQNIDDTSRSIVRVINRYASSFLYAYYDKGINDLIGLIRIERRDIQDLPFFLQSNLPVTGDSFNPTIPQSPDESVVSTNEDSPNRLYFSKPSEPEAVPITNFFDVGGKDSAIKRIVPLKDSLYIFKQDGIYRLSGNDVSSFIVNLEDNTNAIIAPDSATVLSNYIFFLGKQGITAVTEGSVNVISRGIESDILRLTSFKFPNTPQYCFGVTYESDRSYLIFLPTNVSDTSATQCFRYNIITRAWTRWLMDKQSGIVLKADDKLYLGDSNNAIIDVERKDFDRTDYCDREYVKSLLEDFVNGNVITATSITEEEIDASITQEQYITIARFNRLLLRLDGDYLLDDTDYFSSLEIVPGDSLATKLNSLITKVALDDLSYSYVATQALPDGTIAELRDKFNALVIDLNTTLGTSIKTYRQYTDLVIYESIITGINTFSNTVTLADTLPLLAGSYVIFVPIRCQVQWGPQAMGSTSTLKQIREATLMYDQFSFTKAEFVFRSDISDSEEITEFEAEGNGAYGTQIYGTETYGGGATQKQQRTYVPRNKQRCRFLIVGFNHNISRESFSNLGYSLTYNGDTSERAYKR